MPSSPQSFLSDAEALLGPRGLTSDAEVMAPWLTDWRGRYTGQALALASPATTGELSDLVRLCAHSGIAIVPQGGNSGMSGGATPDSGGRQLLVSLRRMNAIRAIERNACQVTCEAGTVLQTLHAAVEDQGLRFPLTLGGKGSATIGGMIATNAGGSQVLRHGTMRAQVLGLEAVLADGSVFSSLIPLKKDNRGFDLKQLFIGSEGTLGIVTAATLRLLPAIEARATAWAGVATIHAARALLRHAEATLGEALEGFEVLPQSCLDAVLDYLPAARAPLAGRHGWHVLIEAVGPAELRERSEAMLGAALDQGLIEDAVLASSEAQAEALWTLRESVSPAERAKGPAMQHDLAVQPADMPEFLDQAVTELEAAFAGTRAFGFGHLGDGNIHFHVQAPSGTAIAAEWELGQGKAISGMVHDLVSQWHGTISAEHGIGQLKRSELARLADPVSLSLLRRVKAALDPQELFNPGKLL